MNVFLSLVTNEVREIGFALDLATGVSESELGGEGVPWDWEAVEFPCKLDSIPCASPLGQGIHSELFTFRKMAERP